MVAKNKKEDIYLQENPNPNMKKLAKALLGLEIVAIEYMSKAEIDHAGWDSRPFCIKLSNGAWLYPMRDDEGNDGGALRYTGKDIDEQQTIPVW